MEYRVTCGCGKALAVSEGAAGSAVACPCGRSVEVPSLRELRRLNGLPETTHPVLVIQRLLAAGELPPPGGCTRCGRHDADTVHVTAVCERRWTRRRSEFRFGIPSLLWFARLLIADSGGRNEDVQEFGWDVTLRLPLRMCPVCRPDLRRGAVLRETLRQVPAYAQLIDRYPDAKLSLAET
jgi:hypothetical protein